MESEKSCIICGEEKNKHFIHKLDCGHDFHYECIVKCFKSCMKDMRCPYCRSNQNNKQLPIVNGIKKYHKGIHYTENLNEIKYENIKCQYILKSGKNKDNKCNNNCKLGYNYCGKHKT